MQFKHYLSQLVVNIDNAAGADIESVIFKSLVPTAGIELDGEAVTVTPAVGVAAADIKAEAVTAGTKYRAVIVPQTAAFAMEIKIKNGGVIATDIPESIIKQGYTYSISAEVTSDFVKATLSSEIQNWEDGGQLDGTPVKEATFNEYLDSARPYFEYDGVNYNVVKLADGRWWMAQNLAYLPRGLSASDSPSATSADFVFYPYTSDGTTCTALTDAASVRERGYLYKAEAVFGEAVTASNYSSFEGAQGICPKGWHVPTRAEYFALVGYSNKSEYLGETDAQSDSDAYYYNSVCNGGKVGELTAAGFNVQLVGAVANNIYQKLIISSSNCTVEDYYGNPSMTYYWTSSPNKANQLFALMTTFTKTGYPEGRLSLAYADVVKAGCSLRCVRDDE